MRNGAVVWLSDMGTRDIWLCTQNIAFPGEHVLWLLREGDTRIITTHHEPRGPDGAPLVIGNHNLGDHNMDTKCEGF